MKPLTSILYALWVCPLILALSHVSAQEDSTAQSVAGEKQAAENQSTTAPKPDAPNPLTMAKFRSLLEEADAAYRRKDYSKTLSLAEEADKLVPNQPYIHNIRGAILIKEKKFEEARAEFEKALEKEPGFFPGLFNVAESYFMEGNYPEARRILKNLLQDTPNNELVIFKLFLCDYMEQKWDSARQWMNTLKYPSDTAAWYYAQAAWELHQGNKSKARDYLSGAEYIFGDKTAIYDESFEDIGLLPIR